jgi:flagellar hook-associated protein FlgK
MHIAADLGYTFDFIPAVLPQPTVTNLTAGSPPSISISGLYKDPDNETHTFRVVGTGSIGNGILRLDQLDGSGAVVSSHNIGAGYAAGDHIELRNGLRVALSSGQVNDGDSFQVDAFATTDTSGFLAAAGLHAFFSGTSAAEMRVREEVSRSPDAISSALGGDLADNAGALRLAAVQDAGVDSLSGMTPNEYYHRAIANLGQEVALRASREDNIEAMVQNLRRRQSDISGVDINDEAAQLLVFEKMFQAVAKYMTTLKGNMDILMNLV